MWAASVGSTGLSAAKVAKEGHVPVALRLRPQIGGVPSLVSSSPVTALLTMGPLVHQG